MNHVHHPLGPRTIIVVIRIMHIQDGQWLLSSIAGVNIAIHMICQVLNSVNKYESMVENVRSNEDWIVGCVDQISPALHNPLYLPGDEYYSSLPCNHPRKSSSSSAFHGRKDGVLFSWELYTSSTLICYTGSSTKRPFNSNTPVPRVPGHSHETAVSRKPV